MYTCKIYNIINNTCEYKIIYIVLNVSMLCMIIVFFFSLILLYYYKKTIKITNKNINKNH